MIAKLDGFNPMPVIFASYALVAFFIIAIVGLVLQIVRNAKKRK